MKILIIGSGGREHAIAHKIRRSSPTHDLFIAPGNPGTASLATPVPLKVTEIDKLVTFATTNKIDLSIVGPEQPLSLGIVDAFRKSGLAIFGPTQAAARLESSKNFAKEIMNGAGVPTAQSWLLHGKDEVLALLQSHRGSIVLKADGLAAGKGVFVCHTEAERTEAVQMLFSDLKAHDVLAEEFLTGVEASFIVATDGERIVPLPPAHDYKRIGEGDVGLNTGGMGSVCPTPRMTPAMVTTAIEQVIRPVLQAMAKRGTPFQGFLYAGLMIEPAGTLKVIEFNARLGDPETQSILELLDADLAALLYALATGDPLPDVKARSGAAVCVVLAARGYPMNPTTGDTISGIDQAESLSSVSVFHAGTCRDSTGQLQTSGGRVLGVTAYGSTIDAARAQALKACDMIQFAGRQMRRDVGRA